MNQIYSVRYVQYRLNDIHSDAFYVIMKSENMCLL